MRSISLNLKFLVVRLAITGIPLERTVGQAGLDGSSISGNA
jgi:hypothetical protein